MRGPAQSARPEAGPGESRHRLFWLSAFAVAMGVLESSVVVYLAELYRPFGQLFPIAQAPPRINTIEMMREATTLVMLLAVASLAGRSALDRFFVFAYLFGVWDILYYVGLRVFLGWPASLLTWDVLFLIPVPWVAPVLCPVLVSLFLIAGFVVHEVLRRRGRALDPSPGEWAVASVGGLAVVLSFCWHWRVFEDGTLPAGFPWGIFFAGLVVGTAPLLRAAQRAIRGHLRD